MKSLTGFEEGRYLASDLSISCLYSSPVTPRVLSTSPRRRTMCGEKRKTWMVGEKVWREGWSEERRERENERSEIKEKKRRKKKGGNQKEWLDKKVRWDKRKRRGEDEKRERERERETWQHTQIFSALKNALNFLSFFKLQLEKNTLSKNTTYLEDDQSHTVQSHQWQ